MDFIKELNTFEWIQMCWMIFITIGIIKIAWMQDRHDDKINDIANKDE